MSGASSRRKGHDWERLVARLFRDAMPGAGVRRGLQYQDGVNCPDVHAPGFHIECKRHRRTNPKVALAQAIRDMGPGVTPIAVCKDDGESPTVTLLLDDFLDLVKEWWHGRQQ